jgi:hypothetical protein
MHVAASVRYLANSVSNQWRFQFTIRVRKWIRKNIDERTYSSVRLLARNRTECSQVESSLTHYDGARAQRQLSSRLDSCSVADAKQMSLHRVWETAKIMSSSTFYGSTSHILSKVNRLFWGTFLLIGSRDSVVGIATGRPRGRSSSPGRVKNFIFSKSCRSVLEPLNLLSNGYRGLFPRE